MDCIVGAVGPAAGCTIIFHGPKSSGESCAMVVFP
jgi:hypothetical protein